MPGRNSNCTLGIANVPMPPSMAPQRVPQPAIVMLNAAKAPA
jgi:hypothetical protein